MTCPTAREYGIIYADYHSLMPAGLSMMLSSPPLDVTYVLQLAIFCLTNLTRVAYSGWITTVVPSSIPSIQCWSVAWMWPWSTACHFGSQFVPLFPPFRVIRNWPLHVSLTSLTASYTITNVSKSIKTFVSSPSGRNLHPQSVVFIDLRTRSSSIYRLPPLHPLSFWQRSCYGSSIRHDRM